MRRHNSYRAVLFDAKIRDEREPAWRLTSRNQYSTRSYFGGPSWGPIREWTSKYSITVNTVPLSRMSLKIICSARRMVPILRTIYLGSLGNKRPIISRAGIPSAELHLSEPDILCGIWSQYITTGFSHAFILQFLRVKNAHDKGTPLRYEMGDLYIDVTYALPCHVLRSSD